MKVYGGSNCEPDEEEDQGGAEMYAAFDGGSEPVWFQFRKMNRGVTSEEEDGDPSDGEAGRK